MFGITLSRKKKKRGREKTEDRRDESMSVIDSFVQREYDDGLSEIVPDAVWDMIPNWDTVSADREQVSFDVMDMDSGKMTKVKSHRVGDTLTQFGRIAILLSSDNCTTQFFHYRSGEDPFEKASRDIPYNIDQCEYAITKQLQDGDSVYASITSFDSPIRLIIERYLGAYFKSGGSVVKVYDRMIPLTQYVASRMRLDEGETILSIDQHDDFILMWTSVRMKSRLIPVNQVSFRIPPVREGDIFREKYATVTGTLAKEYKFAIPRKIALLSNNDMVSTGWTFDEFNEHIAEVSRLSPVVFRSGNAALEGMPVIEGIARPGGR